MNFSFVIFSQNIVTISAPGLNCAGDQTTITVETDYTNPIPNLPTGLTYNLLQANSSSNSRLLLTSKLVN